jgi:hypothetical protein
MFLEVVAIDSYCYYLVNVSEISFDARSVAPGN